MECPEGGGGIITARLRGRMCGSIRDNRASRRISSLLLWAASAAAREPPLVALDVGHFTAEPGATSGGAAGVELTASSPRSSATRCRRAACAAPWSSAADGRHGASSAPDSAAVRGAVLFLSGCTPCDSAELNVPLEERTDEGETCRFSDRFVCFSLFASCCNLHVRAKPRLRACLSVVRWVARVFWLSLTIRLRRSASSSKPSWTVPTRSTTTRSPVRCTARRSRLVLFEAGVIVNRAEALGLRDAGHHGRHRRSGSPTASDPVSSLTGGFHRARHGRAELRWLSRADRRRQPLRGRRSRRRWR